MNDCVWPERLYAIIDDHLQQFSYIYMQSDWRFFNYISDFVITVAFLHLTCNMTIMKHLDEVGIYLPLYK